MMACLAVREANSSSQPILIAACAGLLPILLP